VPSFETLNFHELPSFNQGSLSFQAMHVFLLFMQIFGTMSGTVDGGGKLA
jgi:hypothetical protein